MGKVSRLITGGCACLAALLLVPAPSASAAVNSAVAVLGQAGSFTSSLGGGITQSRFGNAGYVAIDDVRRRIFLTDGNNRVTVHQLDSAGRFIDDSAEYVIGQSDFTSGDAGLAADRLDTPKGLAYDPARNRLYVADDGNKRVLVYELDNITNGMLASWVLGQADLVSNSGGTTQSTLQTARDVELSPDNRYLFVADRHNDRVMVWDTTTISTGMNAAYVLGQSSFTASIRSATQSSTIDPNGLGVDRTNNRLWVAQGNRVTMYELASLATNMNASAVLGQSTYMTNSTGLTSSTFNTVLDVAASANRVWVVDRFNQRVMVFDTTAIGNGEPAIAVLGQPNFTSSTVNNGGRSASSLAFPTGVTHDPSTNRVYVVDSLNNRVLAYGAVFEVAETSVQLEVVPSLTFTVSGHAGACNGVAQSSTSSVSGSSIALGRITSSGAVAAQSLSVSSNGSGYTVAGRSSGPLGVFDDVGGTNAAPVPFPAPGTEAFGYTTSDATLSGTANRFVDGGDKWAAMTTGNVEVASATGPVNADTNCVGYRAQTGPVTPAGSYSTNVIYTAVSVF